MRYKLFIPLSLFLLFILGCVAGQESFDAAQRLSKQGRLEEAVKFYEKAFKENPENDQFSKALNNAKEKLAMMHYNRAEKYLEENPEPNFPELTRIFKDIDRAHSLDPDNESINNMYIDLKGRKDKLLQDVRFLYTKTGEDLNSEKWLEAIERLKRVKQLFPGYEEVDDRLALARGEAVKIFYKQGVKFSKEEDWGMAVEAFKIGVELDPDYFDIQRLYQIAKSNDNIDYFINKGEEAIKARDWDRAISLYKKALEYEPGSERWSKRLEALKLKAGEEHFDKAMKFSSQRQLTRAVEELETSLKYSPNVLDSRFSKDFISSLCQKLDQRSDVYIELRKWGNALVWLKKLNTIEPDYKGLFHKLQLVRDKIKNRIRKSIAVFDFSSPSENQDSGKIVSNKLISYLSRNASGDMKIIERENLQSILKEMQLGQTGLIDMDTAKKVGKMRGIDTFILGDVLHFSSKSKNYPSKNTVRVQIDARSEPNPEFEKWRIVHPKPTQEEMEKAPPMKIEKPVYKLYTYETGTTKIVSFMEIAYKLVNTITGENIFTDTISGKLTEEDDYHHGLPAADIQEDPLELPTELEVLDELTNQKISEVGLSVLKHFQSLELVYFNQAEEKYKRRKYEDAIEMYTDAIFDERLKGISSPISKKSEEMISKLVQNM